MNSIASLSFSLALVIGVSIATLIALVSIRPRRYLWTWALLAVPVWILLYVVADFHIAAVRSPFAANIWALTFPVTVAMTRFVMKPKKPIVLRLGKYEYTMDAFSKGWLITGAIGSGKTASAISMLLGALTDHAPNWGGVVIDEKGDFHELIGKILGASGRRDKLVKLTIHPADDTIFNPLTALPLTAEQLSLILLSAFDATQSSTNTSQSGASVHFRTQAKLAIQHAITLQRAANATPALDVTYRILTNPTDLKNALASIAPTPPIGLAQSEVNAAQTFLEETLLKAKAGDVTASLISTITNILSPYNHPDLHERFSHPTRENTSDFSQVGEGTVFCVSLPEHLRSAKLAVSTILKELLIAYARMRWEDTERDTSTENPIVLVADEGHRFLTGDEPTDILRSAGATLIVATQSYQSLVTRLGQDRAADREKDFRNRVIFLSSDKLCAERAADRIGQSLQTKKSFSRGDFLSGSTKRTTSIQTEIKHLVPPYKLLSGSVLPVGTAYICHPDGRHMKFRFPLPKYLS